MKLAQLQDVDAVADLLAGRFALAGTAAEKAALFAASARALATAGVDGGAGVGAHFVPGRVEILGKHTDYAGGSSVVAALG